MDGIKSKIQAKMGGGNSGSSGGDTTGGQSGAGGQTPASGMDGKIDQGLDSQMTNKGVPAKYDNTINNQVNKEAGNL
ncbi:MAG: hypothetical protein CYPHOPRED_003320 [Cyphobasidiales sp. Tagirdzhanova-0007]|nr:MAG: hypothetical protein CYPHOPRED_003320 [Cyphobasidiales sp. Tagirdzhanova-0007]